MNKNQKSIENPPKINQNPHGPMGYPPFLAALGAYPGVLAVSWGFLGAFWGVLGRSWGVLGGVLAASWDVLGVSWGYLVTSWGVLELPTGGLRAS